MLKMLQGEITVVNKLILTYLTLIWVNILRTENFRWQMVSTFWVSALKIANAFSYCLSMQCCLWNPIYRISYRKKRNLSPSEGVRYTELWYTQNRRVQNMASTVSMESTVGCQNKGQVDYRGVHSALVFIKMQITCYEMSLILLSGRNSARIVTEVDAFIEGRISSEGRISHSNNIPSHFSDQTCHLHIRTWLWLIFTLLEKYVARKVFTFFWNLPVETPLVKPSHSNSFIHSQWMSRLS